MSGSVIVWISGATQGLGAGLARTVPYPGARVVNLSRRQHPYLESVHLDLADPATWTRVADHFERELTAFDGELAIFVHNAYLAEPFGFVGEVDREQYTRHVLANVAAPLVLGDAFVRACRPQFESGLLLISSAMARIPAEGVAAYCGGKAAIEQWVRTVRRERQRRGAGPWLLAVRPGSVATPAVERGMSVAERDWPIGEQVRAAVEDGLFEEPDDVARKIWSLVPPDAVGRSVEFLGAPPPGVEHPK